MSTTVDLLRRLDAPVRSDGDPESNENKPDATQHERLSLGLENAKPSFETARLARDDLLALRAFLQNVADGIDTMDLEDRRILLAVEGLRQLLEAVYEQAITFEGEARADSRAPADLDSAQRTAAAARRAFAVSSDDAIRTTWTVENQTDGPVELLRAGGPPAVVPAFGRRSFDFDPAKEFQVDELIARNAIEIGSERTAPADDDEPYMAIVGFYFLLVPAYLIYGGLAGPAWWWYTAPAFAIPVLAVFLTRPDRRERLRLQVRKIPGRLAQLLSLLLVLVLSLSLPGAIIFFGADVRTVVDALGTSNGPSDHAAYLTLIGRSLQLVFIAAASMLPALLYFQFDRDRLKTLREKFTHQIFRLDPLVHTIADVNAKYGIVIDEIYGTADSGRLLPGRRSPVVVATLVIMLGWMLTLLNSRVEVITDDAGVAALFEPHTSAITFAFLGAYFFALYTLLRGYVRRDLRPKSYTDITIRIFTVVILAWTLEQLLPDDASYLLVMAFLTGIVPQTAINLLIEFASVRPRGRTDGLDAAAPGETHASTDTLAELRDKLPLTDLEGIDLYDRTRLASEGVTNIEASPPRSDRPDASDTDSRSPAR